MPVTFTSHGYDTTEEKPYLEGAWAEAHPAIGACEYGVRSASDWKVTAVAGADRTVSVAAGFGWGRGVTDETVANDTLQLDAIVSGTRWDMIATRRDWTPTAGESKFVVVKGGAGKSIPGGRLSDPGGIDDQPIALVQVTAGQTQPTAIVDLRVWASNGGAVAKDVLSLGYLATIGAQIKIGNATWRYALGTNDIPGWSSDAPDVKAVALASGYAALGGGAATPQTQKTSSGRVFLDGSVGASGASVNIDAAFFRYKLCDLAAGHWPPTLKTFRVPANANMGAVHIYVYPAGSDKEGTIEYDATVAAGVLPKTGNNAFFIHLDGFNWPVA